MTTEAVRRYIGEKLRRFADRIDDDGAPRFPGLTFTFETGKGLVVHDPDEYPRRGCELWYLGRREWDKAFTEADTPWRGTSALCGVGSLQAKEQQE